MPSLPSRRTDPSKNIAVSVTPEQRTRVERLHDEHNKRAEMPQSKSAIYRWVMETGLKECERQMDIPSPAGRVASLRAGG